MGAARNRGAIDIILSGRRSCRQSRWYLQRPHSTDCNTCCLPQPDTCSWDARIFCVLPYGYSYYIESIRLTIECNSPPLGTGFRHVLVFVGRCGPSRWIAVISHPPHRPVLAGTTAY